MSKDFLDDRRKSLEEEFFHQENQKDMATFRDKLARQSTREELRKASSMEDEGVLDKLVEMGLTGDTIVALSLVPLLRVAWADGEIQENERQAILHGAKGKGIEEDSPGAKLLAGWLGKKPDKKLYEAWAAYIHALRSELTEEQSKILRTQVTRFAQAVAEAAGGFLGFRSVSKEEKEAITWIESVFDEKVERKARKSPGKAKDDTGKAKGEDSKAKADGKDDGKAKAKADAADDDAKAQANADADAADDDAKADADADADAADDDADAKADADADADESDEAVDNEGLDESARAKLTREASGEIPAVKPPGDDDK